MNYERINELENFAEEFNNKIEEAFKNYEENLQKDNKLKKDNENNKSQIKEKKKKSFDPPSWKYNSYTGSTFEKLKINNGDDLNPWQIYRSNLIERTYTKEKELPQKKDFKFTKSYGKEFGDQKSFNSLSELGRSIVTKFVKENEIKENILKQKEEEIYNYKHSKPPLELNDWRFSNHIIEEFSKLPCDKVHSFKKELKNKKYLIQEPFKRTKIEGDYFKKI